MDARQNEVNVLAVLVQVQLQLQLQLPTARHTSSKPKARQETWVGPFLSFIFVVALVARPPPSLLDFLLPLLLLSTFTSLCPLRRFSEPARAWFPQLSCLEQHVELRRDRQ